MRANFRMQRLFVAADISEGQPVEVGVEQFNYLANVLRLEADAEILIFNGRDGNGRPSSPFRPASACC